MKKNNETVLLLLRIALGWLFLYSGLTKVMDPAWTSAGFLGSAKSFSGLFAWFGSPENIGWVDFLNQWGQLAIGVGLLTGTLTRLASYAGILMMVLYYFPGLEFPRVERGYLIDSHIIYALAFLVLAQLNAGQYWGGDQMIKKKFKKIKAWWF